MDEPQIGNGSVDVVARRRNKSSITSSRSSGKRSCASGDGTTPTVVNQAAVTTVIISNGTPSPCGACKFLRRKCVSGCIFAPYFGSDRGAAKFAAVHKVFGASNVSKLLLIIPVNRRHDAVVTISYEAQARLSDPVYGCVSTIIALQQQVATLQSELAMVQTQLMNNRFTLANAFQGSQIMPQQQQQQNNILSMLQPAYSNTSSVTNNNYNFVNLSNFNSNSGSFDLIGETVISGCFDPIHELPHTTPLEEEEEEEDSHVPISFTNQTF